MLGVKYLFGMGLVFLEFRFKELLLFLFMVGLKMGVLGIIVALIVVER